MRAVAKFNAKNPSERFYDDSKAKQNEMCEDTRVVVDRRVTPLYDELERLRVSRPDDRSPLHCGASASDCLQVGSRR
jgi:hypothetical protein